MTVLKFRQKVVLGMFKAKRKYVLLLIVLISLVYWFSLPAKLFNDPYSTVLLARDGALLSASIAGDGQWRFPSGDSLPEKFAEALITFEDKRFYKHPGIDILALGRAFKKNISAGKIISGGSTISMQVIRLSRKGKPRTFLEKAIEIILATRLELRYSKKEILSLYAAHAPFGGNVVGLEAACWRYFGTRAADLSWSQAALLAVLPNAPSLIHPGKNRQLLKAKRDRLLDQLEANGKIDSLTCALAKAEPLPEEPFPLPRYAKHLLLRMVQEGLSGKKLSSTVDYYLQQRIERILNDHHKRLRGNQVFNAAALVLDVHTGSVLAYMGNVDNEEGEHGDEVDVIAAPRSTGSILKPFLFAAMLDEGRLLPHMLLSDVPVLIGGFAPKNFSRSYDGAVPADRALIRSLNVPFVYLLRDYRFEKFHTLLKNIGMTTLHHPPDHYGLTLILGGAEGTLWDITGMYASMARTLNNYFTHPGKNRYVRADFHPPVYYYDEKKSGHHNNPREPSGWLSASSIYLTFEALKELYRPGEESGWQYFSSSKKIAWKTGTSFGFRDGWAVGVTPDYAVGVWVGNADGEGRPGLTGTDAAAPILFDIFSLLPGNRWFEFPRMEMDSVAICKKSGHRASSACTETGTAWVTLAGLGSRACPYHKIVHLSKDRKYRVHDRCENINEMIHTNRFILPPVQEYYYRKHHLSYEGLPPFRSDCEATSPVTAMELVYPKPGARIFIPRELDGTPGHSVFELAHSDPTISVYWHLDNIYIGSTKNVHKMLLNPDEGEHTLTLIDDKGEVLETHFTVLSRF